MGWTEIILIIVGAVILIVSFVLPAGRNENAEVQVPKIDEKQIRDLIEKEIHGAKNHINDMVDETLTYSMEKTERAMERLTNEKIMAISEYSEQVLEAINKNHQEVIFLYDMLNDKHENLVNTVSEAARRAKEIKQTVQDAEITVREVSDGITAEGMEVSRMTEIPKRAEVQEVPEMQVVVAMSENSDDHNKTEETMMQEAPGGAEILAQMMSETEFVPIAPKKIEIVQEYVQQDVAALAEAKREETIESAGEEDKTYNNNEKILRLHKLGMSKTAIAKELGLGVGEVKLVIDLFEQA